MPRSCPPFRECNFVAPVFTFPFHQGSILKNFIRIFVAALIKFFKISTLIAFQFLLYILQVYIYILNIYPISFMGIKSLQSIYLITLTYGNLIADIINIYYHFNYQYYYHYYCHLKGCYITT